MLIITSYISLFSILAPTIVGILFYKKFTKELKVLVFFVLFSFLIEGVAYYLRINRINNMFILHLHSWIEFFFIAAIYYKLTSNQNWKTTIILFTLLFSGLSLLNLLYLEDLSTFNSNQRYMEGILVIALFIVYLFQLMSRPKQEYLENHPFFILTVGFLIYFLGTLFLFLFSKEILSQSENSYWALHGILNIFLNIIYTVVLWKGRILLTITSY